MLLHFLLSLSVSQSLSPLLFGDLDSTVGGGGSHQQRRPALSSEQSIEPLLFCFRLAEMASASEQRLVPASSNSRKNRADPGWKYVQPVEEKNTNDTICNFCSKLMKGGITRAKEHLIGKNGNVAKCIKVPKEVKEELIKYMKQKKRQCSDEVEAPNAMELHLENLGFGLSEEDAKGVDDIADPSPRVRNGAGTLKDPMDLFVRNLETATRKRNMAKLRQQNIKAYDKEVSNHGDKHRKPLHFATVVREVMKLHSVRHLLNPILEPLVRRVVKEEVELALKKHITSMKQTSGKEMHTFESRSLQLQFENNISLPVFTGARIEGEDGSNLRIVLLDVLTGNIVSSGSESLAKVEIVVLDGDFEDESEIWTPEEFRSNIVREREGKKPLLTGDVILYLKDGTGTVGEISFTDKSSWTRSRRFRLGAKVVDNFDGVRIREAKTESFIVRDHRGELYKKHHPPNLFDEVWRLEKIGKDGAFHKRLSREKIYTVKDFLTLLNLDPAKLRSNFPTTIPTRG